MSSSSIFDNPILQSFLVKTNLCINLINLVTFLPLTNKLTKCYRSGTIIALKYKDIIKGQDNLFKTKIGFKNACHLIMCYTLNKRKKKMIHIKITAVGTFQIVGIPIMDVEKVVYKIFLMLEKINKLNYVFWYELNHNNTLHNRLEMVIVPILNNYMLTLDHQTTTNIFQKSKVQIVQKFIDNNFLSFVVPNDPAITIKKSFAYKDFCGHHIPYIVWNKKYGKIEQYIDYDSYTTILKGTQKDNAKSKKYLTLRLYSTGKVLVSGFDEILIQEGVKLFLNVCGQF